VIGISEGCAVTGDISGVAEGPVSDPGVVLAARGAMFAGAPALLSRSGTLTVVVLASAGTLTSVCHGFRQGALAATVC
jgi:hypothetical protein